MKSAIIFDLDGTLWDTTKQIENVWNEVAKKYNLKINSAQIKEIMGLTKEDIINYLFPKNTEKGIEFIEICQKSENEYLSENGGHIYKNTLSTIKILFEKFDLYIVSNCQSGYIDTFLKYYDLAQYFKDYECSGNTGKSKEYNIKFILQRNHINNAIYVGDTENDYQASSKNNLKFIWAKYGFGICKNYYGYINDISELLEILK